MAVYMVSPRPVTEAQNRQESMVPIGAYKDGQLLPVLTLISLSPDFPINDLRGLAANLTDALNGASPSRTLSANGQALHFERLDDGALRLRPRDPSGGVSREAGALIAINHAAPPELKAALSLSLDKALRKTFDGVSIALAPVSQPATAPPGPSAPRP